MNALSMRLKQQLKTVVLAALVALAGVGTTLPVSKPASAQVVVCANCSDIVTQLMEYAEQLAQYAKQVQQYELQIQQWQNMVKNTMTIPQSIFDNALNTVRGIESIMNTGSNIRYMMANLDGQFRSFYPGVYDQIAQLRGISSAQSLLNEYSRHQQSFDSALTALRAAQQQSYDMASDQYRMDYAGWSLIGADGNLDAMQAAGEYAQMSAQQLMKLRQLALVQIQMQASIEANRTRDADLKRAAVEIWTTDKPMPAQQTPHRSEAF
ncbi:MAG: P-type conjugative transfer protein TrbJ [Burkholderiales bacterium]|nr:P-type conjugative transfer protein TrbJ [Burkholderiales bacterium]